jgi:hypothetical protein
VADPAFVLDVKLVGEKSWARAPHNKHILQAASYAVQNDSPRWILLYVRGSTIFDEESPEVETRIFAGNADVEYAQELCGIWEMVDRHRKAEDAAGTSLWGKARWLPLRVVPSPGAVRATGRGMQ